MLGNKILYMEEYIMKVGGDLNHLKRVLHIGKILATEENIAYNDDVLLFASYYHDISTYPAYNPQWPFDHALESSKFIPELAAEMGCSNNMIDMIVEAVKYHNKTGLGQYNETKLIRNADAIDYLGYMAVARDFSTYSKDMKQAISALKRRKEMFVPLIDIDYAKYLAAPKIERLDHFISLFEEESFSIY